MAKKHGGLKKVNICPICNAIIPNGSKRCLVCGGKTEFEPDHTTVRDHDPSKEIDRSTMAKRKHFPQALTALFISILGVAVLATSAFEFISMRRLEGIYNTTNAYAFQQNRNQLLLKLEGISAPIEIEGNYRNFANTISMKSSTSGRYVSYLNNQTTVTGGVKGYLVLLDLVALDPNSQQKQASIIVSENRVVDYAFVPNENSLVYLTESEELYLYDFRNIASRLTSNSGVSTLLDTSVKGISEISLNTVLYYKGFHVHPKTLENNQSTTLGNTVDLYKVDCSPKEPVPILIDKDVYTVVDSHNKFSTVIYTKLTETKTLSVFAYRTHGRELLIPSADFVSAANAETGEVVYGVKKPVSFKFSQLIEDDLMAWDVSYDLSKNPRFLDGEESATTLDNLRANDTAAEREILAQELATAVAVENPETTAVTEAEAITEAASETSPPEITDSGADNPLEHYNQLEIGKPVRERFRSALSLFLREYNSKNPYNYSLYYSSNFALNSKVLTHELYPLLGEENMVVADLKEGVVLFSDASAELFQRELVSNLTLSTMSDIVTGGMDIEAFLAGHFPEHLYLYNTNSETRSLLYNDPGERVISRYRFSPDFSEIYLVSLPHYRARNGMLYLMSFDGTATGSLIYVDDLVNMPIGNLGGEIPGLVYQTISNDTTPEYELYLNASAGAIHLASQTSSEDYIMVDEVHNVVYFYTDYSPQTDSSDLRSISDLVERPVGDNIRTLAPLTNGTVVLVMKSGSLWKLVEKNPAQTTVIGDNVYNYHFFDSTLFPELD